MSLRTSSEILICRDRHLQQTLVSAVYTQCFRNSTQLCHWSLSPSVQIDNWHYWGVATKKIKKRPVLLVYKLSFSAEEQCHQDLHHLKIKPTWFVIAFWVHHFLRKPLGSLGICFNVLIPAGPWHPVLCPRGILAVDCPISCLMLTPSFLMILMNWRSIEI